MSEYFRDFRFEFADVPVDFSVRVSARTGDTVDAASRSDTPSVRPLHGSNESATSAAIYTATNATTVSVDNLLTSPSIFQRGLPATEAVDAAR